MNGSMSGSMNATMMGNGMWFGMEAWWILVLLLVVLGIAALARYLWGGKG